MSTTQTIIQYWPLILFFLGLAFHVVWTYFRVGSHDEKIIEHGTRIDNLEKNTDGFREDMKVDIKGIKTSMEYVVKSIDELKQNKK
jgi:hypothetical protein